VVAAPLATVPTESMASSTARAAVQRTPQR
jgi:hypothetical protein